MYARSSCLYVCLCVAAVRLSFFSKCVGIQSQIQRHKRNGCCLQVLHLLGEQFEHSEDIIGVSCNIRKQNDRIEVWTKTASNEAMQSSIGKQLKVLLKLPTATTIGYVSHEHAKTHKSRSGGKEDTYTA